jgi:cytochrome oxidase assembly protein ShyY1
MSAEQNRSLLVPVGAALLAFAVLLGLGTWQLERKSWKEGLIAKLEQRLNEAPVALPPASEWPGMTPDGWEFTRVRLRVQFLKDVDALVYTSGSQIRDDVQGAGYFVFSPALGLDGKQVVINRGYVPARAYPAASGVIEIVGTVRFPEAPSWFVADHDAAGQIWTVRDPALMAKVRGWGEVAPFYIEQESPVPPGGLPHPAALKVRLPNNHLQYAMTWYGLAVVLAVMLAIGAVRRRRANPA